jgi:hypothetical protein
VLPLPLGWWCSRWTCACSAPCRPDTPYLNRFPLLH